MLILFAGNELVEDVLCMYNCLRGFSGISLVASIEYEGKDADPSSIEEYSDETLEDKESVSELFKSPWLFPFLVAGALVLETLSVGFVLSRLILCLRI